MGLAEDHSELNGRRKSWGANNISDMSVKLAIGLPLVFFTVSEKFSGCFQKSPPVKAKRAGARGRGVDGVNRHHSRLHVIFHMAMKHPGSGIVGEHINRHHAARKKFDHVGVSPSVGNGFAVPMRSVQVDLISHSQQVPAHFLSLLHGQAGEIAEDETVDGIKLTRGFASHFIEDHEGGNKFAVNIFGRSVGIRFAFRGNDDRPQQSGVDLNARVDVGVIPPHDGTGLPRARSAGLVGEPVICISGAGSDESLLWQPADRESLRCSCRSASRGDA